MEWLTIHEAAALLRVRVSWIYERTRTNSIPHVKLGKYLRFDRGELTAWLAEFKRDGRRAEPPPRPARIRAQIRP
jgi:excisionase family DNA binding protein